MTPRQSSTSIVTLQQMLSTSQYFLIIFSAIVLRGVSMFFAIRVAIVVVVVILAFVLLQ